MSRTLNESHPTRHSKKSRFPNPFKDRFGYIDRKRRMKPYGLVGYKGYGGETYFRRFGDIIIDIVNKKGYRRKLKQDNYL